VDVRGFEPLTPCLLDTQTTLQRHPCSYFVVDALSPGISPCRRRAPTLCKACLKKSTSRVLFANSCFSLMICLRKISSRDRAGGGWSRRGGHASYKGLCDISRALVRAQRCCRTNSSIQQPAAEIPCYNAALSLVPLCGSFRKVCTIKLSHSRGSLHVTLAVAGVRPNSDFDS
jgi:hypothetical protein